VRAGRKCLDNVNIANPLAMADHLPDLQPETPEPDDNVQTPRKADVRSYSEKTDSIVLEMRGCIDHLRDAMAALGRTMEKNADRIETLARTSAEVKDVMRQLTPKLDDLAGFVKHRAPTLADKSDIAAMKTDLAAIRSEIVLRPTRKQAWVDLAMILGLVGAAITIGARLGH